MAQFMSAGDLREGAGAAILVDAATGDALGGAGAPLHTHEPQRFYIGGVRVVCDGEQLLALPEGTTIVQVRAVGGPVSYCVNGFTASLSSPGYVAQNDLETIGPVSNLARLAVYGGGATVYAHLQYWREA